MEVINWRIAAHPMNWITVFLMVFIFFVAVHLTFGLFGGINPKQNATA